MKDNPCNLLLAEDDPDDCLFFWEALEELPLHINLTTVNDGVELMQQLRSSSDSLPDLVFLDLNMPRKNGVECLLEIKQNEKLNDIAIAIYSTSSSEDHIEETFINGANIYIKKPNDFEKLKKILSEIVTINWQYHTSGLNKENFLMRM